MRRAHILRVNHNTEIPSQAIWFDTETDQQPIDEHGVKHVLRFGMAAYSRRTRGGKWTKPDWLRFEKVPELWDWISTKVRPRTRCDLYCHNTSFDLPVVRIFGELPSRGWKLSRAIIDAPPTILTYRKDRSTLRVLDTLNIWRMSLAALGKMVGSDKLPMPDKSASQEEWDRYARQDVQVLIDACQSWWQLLVSEDLGGFAPTLASQSMRIFRHKYMTHNIYMDDNADALALARESYTGGRVECFKVGDIHEPLYLYDINSMYPAVMRDFDYPTKLIGHSRWAKFLDLDKQLEDRLMVARVTVNTDTPIYHHRMKDKLVFPVGEFITSLTTPELQYALDNNHITDIHAVAVYEKAPLFKSFVEGMYDRRLEAIKAGKTETAWQIKILMNSLYGKFGQRGIVWESEDDTKDWNAKAWTEVRYETGEVTHFRQFGGLVQRRKDAPESADSHPAIAAHVTAYARMLLWSMMLEAGRANVYYCDTDSLLVNQTGSDNLQRSIDPTRLGALKLEGTYTNATLHGPKDYRMGDKVRTKGVRASAIWTSPNTITQERWSSLRGLLRLGNMDAPTTRTISKRLARVYSKGVVESSGDVSPLVLSLSK